MSNSWGDTPNYKGFTMKTEDTNTPARPKPMPPSLADWQIERIRAGLADMRAGRVQPADEVLAEIAAKYGWTRLSNQTP